MGVKLIDLAPKFRGQSTGHIFKTEWGFCAYSCIENIVTHFFTPRPSKTDLLETIRNECPDCAKIYPGSCLVGLEHAVKNYYLARSAEFDCHVDISWAGRFGKKVLLQCCRIKPGQVLSYSQLAKKSGSPKAARAVGQILAKNPTPILIPCHRVVRADGQTGGYSGFGGEGTKKKLIQFEKQFTISI